MYLLPEVLRAQLASTRIIELQGLENVDVDETVSSSLLAHQKQLLITKSAEGGLTAFCERLQHWQDEHTQVFLTVSSSVQASHLQNILLGHDLRLSVVPSGAWQGTQDKRHDGQ